MPQKIIQPKGKMTIFNESTVSFSYIYFENICQCFSDMTSYT